MLCEDLRLNSWIRQNLVCPRDFKPFETRAGYLRCPDNHTYPIVQGVPILLLGETVPTQKLFWQVLERPEVALQVHSADSPVPGGIDPFVKRALAATSGNLYGFAAKNLGRYPIPDLPLPNSPEACFLDLGCNWGRWCFSAARKGYLPIGIDPNLEAVLAARRIAKQLSLPAYFLVADARHLPFSSHSMATVFSYSVLQHFDKNDVRQTLKEVSRVLRTGGTALIEMPNAFGFHNLLHQIRRGFRQAREFEVRYWAPAELKKTFGFYIGPTQLCADGYGTLNPQVADLDMLPFLYRLVVRVSEWFRKRSLRWTWLIYVADSLYIKSAASPNTGPRS
jgi:SAM-dependent methyltransferase/uncharacterized protein YbaR (Trm112 family)